MLLTKYFFWFLPSLLFSSSLNLNYYRSTVLFCYGRVKPEYINDYNIVILESMHYNVNDINKIKKHNKKVYAYLSLGEVSVYAKNYNEFKDMTLGHNENWNSHYLNLKEPKTIKGLMKAVKSIFDKGFDGIFLDNIDNFAAYGKQKNQKNELVNLIKKINDNYPKKSFIQNAGLDLLNSTHKYIDGVVVESVATDYSFKEKKYQMKNKPDYEAQLSEIKEAHKKYNIPVILVEYADSKVMLNKVIKRLSSTDFQYFVGKIDLQKLPSFK